MNEFYTKWKNDKRYRIKIKLLAYTAFVVVVSVYALSINQDGPSNNSDLIPNSNQYENNNFNEIIKNNIINIPENYTYKINITIDNNHYQYYGEKSLDQEIITKEIVDEITNYRYFNNEYYVLINGNYQKTIKEEVYDIVNYNYINLDNINIYLSKAKNTVNQYSVYLKDVILGNESDDYFVILLNNNHINIDYTPLIKEFNNSIQRYIVDIQIETKE